jgi:RNA polymerase sigma-70 factor (ECF subfamily)
MPPSGPDENEAPSRAGEFNTTQWSMVLLAGQSHASRADAALESLCRTYWNPLYAYVRHRGHSRPDAEDLTQAFFARLLEKKYLKLATQERGRFRSFLLKSLQHFLVNEWVRSRAQKRGGGREIFSFDADVAERQYLQQPAEPLAPERLYGKLWAMTLLERAMDRLGASYAAAGKEELFEGLKPLMLSEASREATRDRIRALGLSEGAAKVAIHRLRKRFREFVRAEIAETVATPDEVDGELHCLMAAMTG